MDREMDQKAAPIAYDLLYSKHSDGQYYRVGTFRWVPNGGPIGQADDFMIELISWRPEFLARIVEVDGAEHDCVKTITTTEHPYRNYLEVASSASPDIHYSIGLAQITLAQSLPPEGSDLTGIRLRIIKLLEQPNGS